MTEAVRLVIWDLDETFWKGTLTEGGIQQQISENVEIVKVLTDRGIMNSICSRNNYEEAKAVLVSMEIWESFIFPSIDWRPKGARVAAIIAEVQLRAESVLFLDDNPSNLAEVAAVNPGIQIADHSFATSMLSDLRFRGKDYRSHTRLNQYKILERKSSEKHPRTETTIRFYALAISPNILNIRSRSI